MARNRNRTSAQRTQARRKKLLLQGLPAHLVASIDADGKIQIKSLDLRGKENFGLVSNLGVVGKRLFLMSKPYKEKCDYEYQRQNCEPLIFDRENNICLY